MLPSFEQLFIRPDLLDLKNLASFIQDDDCKGVSYESKDKARHSKPRGNIQKAIIPTFVRNSIRIQQPSVCR